MVEHAVVARGDVSSNLILPPKSASGGTGLHAALKMRCPCGLRVRIPPRRPAHYKTVQRLFIKCVLEKHRVQVRILLRLGSVQFNWENFFYTVLIMPRQLNWQSASLKSLAQQVRLLPAAPVRCIQQIFYIRTVNPLPKGFVSANLILSHHYGRVGKQSNPTDRFDLIHLE